MKRILPLIFICMVLHACALFSQQKTYKTTFRDINSFYNSNPGMMRDPFLKAHLKSGGLCIYTDTTWQYDQETDILSGNAKLYDIQRNVISWGIVNLKTDTVVLFESNRQLDAKGSQNRIATRNILTVIDAAFGVICITNPKACWGSCPTFYTGQENYVFKADAEGFSKAILPSMEYADIDALYNFKPVGNEFSIKMKNEALETHVVRDVHIMAVERDPAFKSYHGTNDEFFLTDPSHLNVAINAQASEGDITHKLAKTDLDERFSPSDPKNMKSREEIVLQFNRDDILEGGLVLDFRQTLMTTYLIYSVMGYMGNTVSDFMAELEKNNQAIKKNNIIDDELGGIEVYLLDKGEYLYRGVFNETGPIALNRQFIPLGQLPAEDKVTIKLVLNKGLWRIDYAALAKVLGKTGVVDFPVERLVYKNKDNPELLDLLNDKTKQLVSMPGDEFEFSFRLPECETEYDLYLCSKGYYLEWMRESWLEDKNLLKLNMLVEDPGKFFRKEARKYSKYEKDIEKIFWESRLNTENFSSHE